MIKILKYVSPDKLRSKKPVLSNRKNILNYFLKYYNYPFHPSTWVFTREVWDSIGEFNPKYEFV